jgi:hypothetical protein
MAYAAHGDLCRNVHCEIWPAPRFEDTELGAFMGAEVGHEEARH